MKITKNTSFNAALAVETETGTQPPYVTFNGSVSAEGVPTTSYYINDANTYLDHIPEFKAALSEFQNTVFTEADKVVAERATTETVPTA